jgi:bleomycin hydrolase
MIAEYDLGEFQLSQTYGQFWDVLEKSNRFLENVIDNRKKPMDSRMNEWLFKKPIGDGGHFVNAAHVISKYGIVPQEIMPEKYSSTENLRLMNVVRTLLRRYGLKLRDARADELQTIKEAALTDIYKVLAANLGEPPTSFVWTMKDKDGNEISTAEYTPASFRDRFIRPDLEKDFVIFMDDPTKPYYRMYEVDNSRNCHELSNWTFLNVPAAELLPIGIESLKDGKMFYFSADTDASALMMGGIYDVGLYDLASMLDVTIDMTKEEMVRSCEIKSLHAMAMAGVELDENGNPVKWLIENSFGTIRGWDGFVIMQNEWLLTYLFRMAVEKQYVPDHLFDLLDQKPKLLKSWNPTY